MGQVKNEQEDQLKEEEEKKIEYPSDWEARVQNLTARFPHCGKAGVVELLKEMDGHAGKVTKLLIEKGHEEAKNAVTDSCPRKKEPSQKEKQLIAAFQLWDIDGNGCIDEL